MTRYWLRAIAGVLACVALVACGTFELPSKKVEYKSAGKLAPLDIPPDLTRPSAGDRFVVPENARGAATYSEYERERGGRSESTSSSTILPTQDDVRVERAGTQRWLVVKGSPEQVWPVVKDFW